MLVEDLTRVLARVVSKPEALSVELVETEQGERCDVRVDPEDLGAVIGRRGRTVNALRTLLGARGMRQGRRYDLRIVEGE